MLTLDLNKIKQVNRNLLLVHDSNEPEALIAEATLQLISDYEKLLKRVVEHDKEAPEDCGPVGFEYD
jgi:hypothetical protein